MRPTGSCPATRDLSAIARLSLGRDHAHLARARAPLYWVDLMASAGVGWGAFLLAVHQGVSSLTGAALACLATLALLRALVFLHEISHRRVSRRFERFWNLVVGVPMGVPSSMYVGSHLEHHASDRFATPLDPEYAPLASWSPLRRLLFVVSGAGVPLLLVVRWGVLAPLSLGPFRSLRPLVVERFSTMAINPGYTRDPDAYRRSNPAWRAQEWACALIVWAVALAVLLGALPVAAAGLWCAVVGGVFLVNQVRTLAAHGYANAGSRLSHDAQFLDSINLASNPLTVLVAPLGLRYHALHHLLPELPYHSLGAAHRLLARRLRDDPLYGRAGELGLARAIRFTT